MVKSNKSNDHYVLRRLLSLVNRNDFQRLKIHANIPSHIQLDPHLLAKISQDLDELGDFKEEFDDTIPSNSAFLSTFPCYEKFKYKAGLSFVLHCGSGLVDVAGDLVKVKIQWAKKLYSIKPKKERDAFKEIETLLKSVRKGSNEPKVSNQEFLDMILNEPEPSFRGSYNWLYTGGCLSSFQDENNTYLCSADFLLDDPVIKFSELSEDCTRIANQQEFTLLNNRPILQLNLKKCQEDLIIGVRQNSTLTILSALENKGTVIRKWKKSLNADRILTSFDFSPSCENVVMTDVDASSRTIKIYSLEPKKKALYSHSGKVWKYKDPWNKVLYRNEEVLLVDRSYFYIIDPRMNGKFSLEFSPITINEWLCERMCNMFLSKSDPNCVYLGLQHSLMQLDIRFPKTVQKWNHLLKRNPQFGNAVEDSDCELLILQGSEIDDLVGITNDFYYESDERILLSKSTPYLLKGIKNSLRVAHYNEIGLNPLVSDRFDCTVTGNCVLKDRNRNIHYFLTNSFGDIFGCKIKSRDDDSNDDLENALDSIKNYEAHIPDLNMGKMFQPHAVVSFLHIFKKVEELGLNKDEPKSYWYPTQWKYREMYTPESLRSFKDYIAQKICAVWGIKTQGLDEFEEEEEDENRDDDEIPFADKVEGWLSRME